PYSAPRWFHLRPRKKGQVGARVTDGIRVKQMIRVGRVLVHTLFHQAQTHHAYIKIQILLRVARNRRDMTKPVYGRVHSFNRPCFNNLNPSAGVFYSAAPVVAIASTTAGGVLYCAPAFQSRNSPRSPSTASAPSVKKMPLNRTVVGTPTNCDV